MKWVASCLPALSGRYVLSMRNVYDLRLVGLGWWYRLQKIGGESGTVRNNLSWVFNSPHTFHSHIPPRPDGIQTDRHAMRRVCGLGSRGAGNVVLQCDAETRFGFMLCLSGGALLFWRYRLLGIWYVLCRLLYISGGSTWGEQYGILGLQCYTECPEMNIKGDGRWVLEEAINIDAASTHYPTKRIDEWRQTPSACLSIFPKPKEESIEIS